MKTSDFLTIGNVYTRKQLQAQFEIKDISVFNGVFHPNEHDSIWLFVTEKKSPDRTPYRDHLESDTLDWDGQTKGRTDRQIINHKSLGLELLLFYRKEKLEFPNYGFRYEGPFEYSSHEGQGPSHFKLVRQNFIDNTVAVDLEGFQEEEEYFEGKKRERYSSYYERNPKLRADAIRIHGTRCVVCGFEFEKVYGKRGKGYIEVHHLRPVSELSGRTRIDPQKDMTVVCSNCHRMIHRRKDSILKIEELTALLNS